MLKVKLFSNYYSFLEKVPLLVNYIFATKIFNIFKSLNENVSVRGEARRRKVHISSGLKCSTSGYKVKRGGPLFSGWGSLIMGGVGKRYYTGMGFSKYLLKWKGVRILPLLIL